MSAQFTLVGEEEVAAPVAAPTAERRAAHQMLMLGLSTLSKRFLVAVSGLFTLATVASVWWLWYSIPDPGSHQLIGLGMYALFILSVNTIVRKK